MKKPELLAPAGDFEKLQMAIAYGADAVYVGGKQFSLRANAKNFDTDELAKAISYAHGHNVKVYVSVNIFAHNDDFIGLREYLVNLKDMGADAIIVADLGVFNIARSIPGLEVHISTQANTTNYGSAGLYKELGASRAILARELSFKEIRVINDRLASLSGIETNPSQHTSGTSTNTSPIHRAFETEVFVHGAMCMSYSGRCLLSNYMAGRDANKGDCAQPCRWKYTLFEGASREKCRHAEESCHRQLNLVEELRPTEYMPIYEDERGTYIMNSKDLCMVEYIPELVASGVSSFKIEGRMKTAYYVAAVTRIYREALDDFFVSESLYISKKDYYMQELYKTSHREFFTGFYLDKAQNGQNLSNDIRNNAQDFLGVVVDYDAGKRLALVEQRNKFSVGDMVEFLKGRFTQTVDRLFDKNGKPIDSAPHPQELVYMRTQQPVVKFDILRKAD